MFQATIFREEYKNSSQWNGIKEILMAGSNFSREEDLALYKGRVDLLVHELMTNMLNHTNGDSCEIIATVENRLCSIECRTAPKGFLMKGFLTNGQAFQKNFPDSSYFRKGNSIVIYRDIDSQVIATVTSDYDLVFHSVLLEERDSGADIPEHYGLSILCQLCDEVCYSHHPVNGDTFKLKITIPSV